MGRYDDIDPEELRRQLVRVAKLIQRLDEEDELLRAAPRLQKLLGDLRQRLFAYEVRCAANLGPEDEPKEEETGPLDEVDDPLLKESLRVVREAMERQEELRDELEFGDEPPEEEEEGEDG